MLKTFYLDYAATTPIDPRVADAMYQVIQENFGNPSSISHSFGQASKKIIDEAREQIADFIQAEPSELIFTSGATEAINLALKGAAQLYQARGKHIVTMKTEHKAVLDTCQYLEKNGFQVTYLNPEPNGILDLEKFKASLRKDTILVSLMHVNNETGVIQNIEAISQITFERGILLHVDAAQSVGKLDIDLKKWPIDLLSMNAHKVYGPKGIGALYLRRKPRVRVAQQIHGGGHEQGMRSGTLATHQIVGMGKAFALAKIESQKDFTKMKSFRELFLETFSKHPRIFINGDLEKVYPGILNLGIRQLKGQEIIAALPSIAISQGSACMTSQLEASYVLRAMGLSEETALSSVRMSFGRMTSLAEIQTTIQAIVDVVSSR